MQLTDDSQRGQKDAKRWVPLSRVPLLIFSLLPLGLLWGDELGFELRPALQEADACEPRRTLMSHSAPC
jgi:hypothetical protein